MVVSLGRLEVETADLAGQTPRVRDGQRELRVRRGRHRWVAQDAGRDVDGAGKADVGASVQLQCVKQAAKHRLRHVITNVVGGIVSSKDSLPAGSRMIRRAMIAANITAVETTAPITHRPPILAGLGPSYFVRFRF